MLSTVPIETVKDPEQYLGYWIGNGVAYGLVLGFAAGLILFVGVTI